MPRSTRYVRAGSAEEAIDALAAAPGDAMVIAGGIVVTSLINTHLAHAEVLVDISGIETLRGIRVLPGGELELGALVRHTELLTSPVVAQGWPLLTALARDIACERLRNQGTLGGSLCTVGQQGDPATGLIALDASVRIRGPGGVRSLALEHFYTGDFAVDLGESELLEAVTVPVMPQGCCWGFYKLGPRKAMDFTLLSAAAVLVPGASGADVVTIGMSGVAPTAIRARHVEERISGRSPAGLQPEMLSQWLEPDIAPADDAVYSAAYKRHAAGVVLQRALQSATRQS